MNKAWPARRGGGGAFTLQELLVALAISGMLCAALLTAVMGLRRALLATEQYSSHQAAQARLLGYLGRDLRNLTGTSAIRSPSLSVGAFTPIGAEALTSNTLTLVVPCYYAAATGSDVNALVYWSGSSQRSGTLGYGSSGSLVTGTVCYFKTTANPSGAQSYVRVESAGGVSGTTTLVENAQGMLLEIMPDSPSMALPTGYQLRVRFTPSFQRTRRGTLNEPLPLPNPDTAPNAEITLTDWVLLRGTN